MNNVTLEQMRLVAISILSPILAFITPTHGFVTSLIIMFAFNIWCGMRADGVSILRCTNFSFSKFKRALWELLLYIVIVYVLFSVMAVIGDKEAAIIAIKSLTYVFMYVYLQNSFKNLIIAYPTNKSYRLIYHVIRFEFTRALPSHIQDVIDRYEREHGDDSLTIKKQSDVNRDSKSDLSE